MEEKQENKEIKLKDTEKMRTNFFGEFNSLWEVSEKGYTKESP